MGDERTLVAHGSETCRRTLAEDGARLVDTGHAEAVLAAADALPDGAGDERILTAVGHARLVRGDWRGAVACFEQAAGGRCER